jgi:hypothetical protein
VSPETIMGRHKRFKQPDDLKISKVLIQKECDFGGCVPMRVRDLGWLQCMLSRPGTPGSIP